MLLVARREKQQLNTEMGRKHISGDVGLMTFDKDSQSPPSFIPLNFSRCVFDALEMDMTSKCACGEGMEMDRKCLLCLLRLNRKRN